MNRRPVDLLAAVCGAVFVVLAAAFVVADLDSFAAQARVVWPVALFGAGAGLLLGSRRR